MSKFNIGDKVRVIKNLYYEDGIKKGQTGVVKYITNHGHSFNYQVYPDFLNTRISDQLWNFPEDYLELVEAEKATQNFKKGDKVRILRNRGPAILNPPELPLTGGLKVGDVVTIIEDVKSPTGNTPYSILEIDRGDQWMRSDDVELVEDQPMPTPEYSCIRVVPPSKPKREIVEGTVILDQYAEIKVMREGSDDTDVKLLIQECPFFTAKALREAAALFTTLAEVLEENAK